MGGFNCGKKRNNSNKRRRDGIASVAPLVYIGRGWGVHAAWLDGGAQRRAVIPPFMATNLEF